MTTPQFWLIAGPNGAGKSTLAKSSLFAALPVPKPLNPDDFTFGILRRRGYSGFLDAPFAIQSECFIQAAEWVFAEVESTVQRGGIVAVETVLSTEKYLPLFRQVAESGGDANLIYIGNQSAAISAERVALRVQKGGHDVPPDKIRSRWRRSLKTMPVFLQIATQAWVFDHSDSHRPPRLVAQKQNGVISVAPTPHYLEKDVLADAVTSSAAHWIYEELPQLSH